MNCARSVISDRTSSCLPGGSFTVVICVTTSLVCVMAVLLRIVGRTTLSRRPGFAASGRSAALGNGVRDRHCATRHVGVHALDHPAVERDDALVAVFRQVEGGD